MPTDSVQYSPSVCTTHTSQRLGILYEKVWGFRLGRGVGINWECTYISQSISVVPESPSVEVEPTVTFLKPGLKYLKIASVTLSRESYLDKLRNRLTTKWFRHFRRVLYMHM